MIRVFLVDDHTAFRQPLAFMMNREPDLAVVAQAGSLKEARSLLDVPVDVVLLDLQLPDGNGIELIDDLQAAQPEAAVIVLTASTSQPDVGRAIERGAAGLLFKSSSIPDVLEGVRAVGRGEHLLRRDHVRELVDAAHQEAEAVRRGRELVARLTPRERDVLAALARGASDKEIAAHLHLSSETVRTHMANILGKLEVESRLQALVVALRHGVVTLE